MHGLSDEETSDESRISVNLQNEMPTLPRPGRTPQRGKTGTVPD